VLQDLNDEKEREMSTLRQKLTAMESNSQQRISELENQLTDALSSAAAAAAAAAAATGEWSEYQLLVFIMSLRSYLVPDCKPRVLMMLLVMELVCCPLSDGPLHLLQQGGW